MRKHRDAAYEIDERRRGRPARGRAAQLGRGGRGRRAPRAPQRAGDGAGADRDDQLPDGLRHDRHRARLLAGEAEGAGGRRPDDDRQPHGPARAAQARLLRRPRSSRSRPTSTTHRTIVGAPGLADEHLPVFDVAVGERAISHMGHIKMMAATQPFISGAISKTVNMPDDSTVGDIRDAYMEAGRLGVKALAIYRDGSKTAQALRTDAKEKSKDAPAEAAAAGAQAPAARARVAHAQVLRRRPRGLHHRRPLRGRLARRDLPDRHRQGRLDPARHDERVRDGDLDRPPVRRAAGDVRAQVQLHALRPRGHDDEPGDPVREVAARLHHALARVALPRPRRCTRSSAS